MQRISTENLHLEASSQPMGGAPPTSGYSHEMPLPAGHDSTMMRSRCEPCWYLVHSTVTSEC